MEIFGFHILDDESMAWIVQIYDHDIESLASQLVVSASLPRQLAPRRRFEVVAAPFVDFF